MSCNFLKNYHNIIEFFIFKFVVNKFLYETNKILFLILKNDLRKKKIIS